MSASDLVCPLFSGFIMLLIGAITIPTYIYPYFYGLGFEKTTCYINEIDYPTTNPTHNDYSNWEKCDCGKRCTSYSPCIKLFTNLSYAVIYDKYPRDSKYDCTFHDKRCSDGEDIRNIELYLESARNTYNEYINTTIDCYIDSQENHIYISLDTSFTLTIISLIFIGLTFICCCCFTIYTKIQDCRSIQNSDTPKKEICNPCYKA